MRSLTLLPSYIIWHYGKALTDILRVWKNFFWFIFNFFSISLLLQTLFSPWQRLDENYTKGFDIEALASTFVVNVLMRLVGAFMRLFLIIMGLICLLFVVVAGVAFFVLWIFAPAVIAVLFILSIKSFVK